MPIPARRVPGCEDRGFTLIEILVVMVIIGVVTGVALLSIGSGGRDREVKQEAQRLAAVLQLASQHAVMQSTQLGLRVGGDGYSFLELDHGEWRPVPRDTALGHHRLPDGMRLELYVEGLAAKLASGDEPRPQVLVLSSGEMTPFHARISAAGSNTVGIVKGTLTGKIDVSAQGAQ